EHPHQGRDDRHLDPLLRREFADEIGIDILGYAAGIARDRLAEADGGALARGQFAAIGLPDRRHLLFRDAETGGLVRLRRPAVPAVVCGRPRQADQASQLVRQYGEFRHRLEVIPRRAAELLGMRERVEAVDVDPETLFAASRAPGTLGSTPRNAG